MKEGPQIVFCGHERTSVHCANAGGYASSGLLTLCQQEVHSEARTAECKDPVSV
jgi:hypothetical protein